MYLPLGLTLRSYLPHIVDSPHFHKVRLLVGHLVRRHSLSMVQGVEFREWPKFGGKGSGSSHPLKSDTQ